MGGFPALMIRPPESPIEQISGVERLKAGIQQQQIGEIQLQEARLNQTSQQELMASFSRNGGDLNRTYADAASSGKVTPSMLLQFRTQSVAAQTQMATLTEKQLANLKTVHDMAANELESIKTMPMEQRPQGIKDALGRMASKGVDISKIVPSLTGLPDFSDDSINRVETGLKGEQWLLANEKAEREKAQAPTTAEAEAQRTATLKETQARGDLAAAEAAEKGSPLTRMEHDPTQMAGDKLPAAVGYLKAKIADPDTEPKDVVRATRLLATATATKTAELAMDASKKAAEQAVTQGSPTAAAQLLVAGDATLSQLKARGSTPEFIANTLTEAKRIKPDWNAQKAEADFEIARSASNLAFFGSAKSLIDRAGTLDQLTEAGKDIPQNQFPVFNTVADAIKASTGSGPIAKYASIALGVADDYAKVMGGGQGSDTAREQALKLVTAKQSPEQREESIKGIRGAVTSQTNSRIGNNPVLQKMYGGSVAPPQGVGKLIDKATAQKFYEAAGGDPDKARRMALEAGWKVR